MNRRGFLAGLVGLAAPAVIRTPGLLMPVRSIAISTAINGFDPMLYEIFRRTYPVLIAQSIIGVQPLHDAPDLSSQFNRFKEVNGLT